MSNSKSDTILLTEHKHNRSSSEGKNGLNIVKFSDDRENSEPNKMKNGSDSVDKENVDSNILVSKQPPMTKSRLKDRAWKPSSLQLCMQLNDPNPNFGLDFYEPINSSKNNSGNIWDHSDSEAAPASSWSTLPNRSLLCRPLSVDIGRCTCIIVKEKSVDALNGRSVYTLYTNEGQGRQNRKLAVAYHRRQNGRSEFIIAQNTKGILCCADDSYLGSVTANLMGSKYHIWDQGRRFQSMTKQSKLLALVSGLYDCHISKNNAYLMKWSADTFNSSNKLKVWCIKNGLYDCHISKNNAYLMKWSADTYNSSNKLKVWCIKNFAPTIATWTGSYRSMKAWLPKHQSMQLKNTTQAQHINGLPKDWEERMDRVHQLFSKVPHYNNVSKQYELDFRNRGKTGLKIQSSVKNFQLTMEKDGRQTILQLGRVGNSKYVMDYRYPLTGYQAFSICLASMDSKLCCTM